MPKGVYNNHASGTRCGRWNDGKIISSQGYVRIRVGKDHPLADPNGYAYEHLIVWVSSGRRRPEKDEIIHHENGDKTDNRIQNLSLMSRAKHNSIHNQSKARNEKGQFSGTAWDGLPK